MAAQEMSQKSYESNRDRDSSTKETSKQSQGRNQNQGSQTAANMESNDVIGSAKEMLGTATRQIQDQYQNARDSFTEYAKRNPFATAGIAVLVGVGIGLLLRK